MKFSKRIERLEYFKSMGWTYNPITGEIISHKGTPCISKMCRIHNRPDKPIDVTNKHFAYYMMTGKVEDEIEFIDKDENNLKYENLKIKPTLNRDSKYYYEKRRVEGRQASKTKYIKHKPKHYLMGTDLSYEIIISQGKGKLTKNAEKMLIQLSENLIRRFNYNNIQDREDCQATGLMEMLEKWKGYNYEKYPDAFPYFTEIAKRGFVHGLDKIKWRDNRYQETPKKINLSWI